nr:hypothetical protein [Tanacetum cinerariifolium]
MKIDPTMTQKEETYQVILDIIKNTTFYKAFLASADVPKIYMQQLKKSICEIMPYPRFTKVIINHFLFTHKSIPKALPSGLYTIKDDGVLSQMKFVRIGEGVQEYGRAIPDAIGKGSQGKKSAVSPKPVSVKVSGESNVKPAKRQLGEEECQRRKFQYQLMTTSFENQMSLWKSDLKPTRRRPSGITFRDNLSVSKKISPDLSQKLKGIRTLTVEEQLVADMMQALKASKKSSRSQPHAGGSSKGTSTKPKVPDESMIILTTLHEGTGTKPGVPDEVQDQVNGEEIPWVSTDEDEVKKEDDDDDKSINLKKTDNEETNDEYVYGDKYVQDDADEEMKDVEVDNTGKCDEEITDMTKADAEDRRIRNLKDTVDAEIKSLVSVLEKDVQELKEVDRTTTNLALLRSKIPLVVNAYLGSSLGDALRKLHVVKRIQRKFLEKVIMMVMIKTKTLLLDQTRVRRPRGEEPKSQSHLRRHPPLRKPLKATYYESRMELGKAVDDSQEHTWFNDLLSTKKGPHMFDERKATPIDFSKFVMNHLKIDKLTKAHLVGPIYNLLKGTCHSSIELEYNMEECYIALFDQLDWNNHEGDHPEKKYITSITKRKAAGYELLGIEDMIPSLWSVTKVALNKQKRVIQADDLYKFLDGTLKLVRDELHHRILNFRLGYNKEMSMRKCICEKGESQGIWKD